MSSSKNMKEINADGISIPNWMKTRKNFGPTEQNFNSPPAHDDSFFFFRYPGSKKEDDKNLQTRNVSGTSARSITEVFEETSEIHTNLMSTRKPDVMHIPKQCRSFLDSNTQEPKGIDDGFIGAGAGICGKSLVKVAEKIITSKHSSSSGLNLRSFQQNEDIEPSLVPHINERRGSRSLPVSPLGSPKLERRLNNPNPYFTITAPPETTQRGFLATLFNIGGSSTTASTQSLCHDVTVEESQAAIDAAMEHGKKVTKEEDVKVQPNQMRELNFWAPTSM